MKYRTIYREMTVEWMKLRIKPMIGSIRKQKATNSEQQEEKRIQNNENSVSSLWDNFKRSDIHIIGVLEGEEKEHFQARVQEKPTDKGVLKSLNVPKLSDPCHGYTTILP